MEIERMLIAPTGHLTRAEVETLEDGESAGPFRAHFTRDEGFMINVVARNDLPDGVWRAGLSAGFGGAVDVAIANDCEWILFDCDGPLLDGVEQYDW